MATTINSALTEFMTGFVNLDRELTLTARTSRDWLLGHIRSFPSADDAFPKPYSEKDILLGSFHRRTKTRPLDDIDLISAIHAEGSTYSEYGPVVVLNVNSQSSRLLSLCHEGGNQLNSKRVLNKFVSALQGVQQYGRAEIGRNGEAAVVNLATYPWSFDVVPAFFTVANTFGKDYYLIPNGNGHWKKTDPRIDEQRITAVKQRHGAIVLPCIRLLKYWNKRRTVPTVASYAFESMILSYYEQVIQVASTVIDVEFVRVLRTIASSILSAIPDPKGIQGDLNNLSRQERIDLSTRALVDVNLIGEALTAEQQGNHQTAMARWRQVVGPDFPAYG